MGWRDLRNAPLIAAFGTYTTPPWVVLPNDKNELESFFLKSVMTRVREDGLGDEHDELMRAYGHNYWRLGTLCALMVWEDMHEILSCDMAHLENLIKMFPDTELSARCEAAQRFHLMVPSRVAALTCAEAKARPRRFA